MKDNIETIMVSIPLEEALAHMVHNDGWLAAYALPALVAELASAPSQVRSIHEEIVRHWRLADSKLESDGTVKYDYHDYAALAAYHQKRLMHFETSTLPVLINLALERAQLLQADCLKRYEQVKRWIDELETHTRTELAAAKLSCRLTSKERDTLVETDDKRS
jgi:hypothetical protein